MSTGACCCCGSEALEPRFAVAGEVGEAGLIPTTDQFGTALSDIVRCRNCGHMQLEQMPGGELLSRLYSEAESEDYVGEEAGQRETARRILERIETYSDPGRILDVGCWVGFMLDEAENRGWRGYGLEPSEWASAYARERLGLNVETLGLDVAELEPGSFAAVFMGDVIEHVIDPAATLAKVRDSLGPGGVLALALPDAGSRLARAMGRRWWAIVPTHVQYFTRESMATLLRRSGFDLLEASTAPKVFSAGYYLGRLADFAPRLGGGIHRLAGRLGQAERMVAPDFGDRMLVLATPATASSTTTGSSGAR